jgi:hypothetical protein
MPQKRNPLNLNALQLKTLALFQALAKLPDHARPAEDDGAVVIGDLPRPHGDHFHLGDAVVLSRDASGLANHAAWVALERKGLIRSRFPDEAVVTKEGMLYDTGLGGSILHRAEH